MTRKRPLQILAGLLGLAVVMIGVWAAIAGPVTVFRILRYGDTNIDDFSHYPGRDLRPSDAPFHLPHSEQEIVLPAEFADDFGNRDLNELLETNDTIAFLVVNDGAVLYERYYQGHGAGSLSQLFSMTKSFTSALIGMAIEDGLIEGVDQPITDFVPELTMNGFGEVTFRHLLTMTSGSSYQENDNPFAEHVILNFTPDLEREILQFSMEREPGELFRYKSGDNALLGLALDRALAPETITDYTQRRLWDPLGMEDRGVWTIDHEGDGLEKTWCCLATSARDIAKFGLLALKDGIWEGQQIIPAAWIKASTRQGQVPEEVWPADFAKIGWWNYGYQWWLASEEDGDFFALGKDGQFLYVNPAKNVLIVRLGWSSGNLLSSQWIRLFQEITAGVGINQAQPLERRNDYQ